MDEIKTPPKRIDWEQRYVEENIPWENGKPDIHLQRVLKIHDLSPGKALDIGCGTGNNVIWLQQQGFDAFGIDIAPTAIKIAKEKAKAAGLESPFKVSNFLEEDVAEAPFQFVYDRGCFHTFSDTESQALFASRVADLLEPEGIWHSLIGSTDGPPRESGPPRRSAAQIMAVIEPLFEILRLESVSFDEEDHKHARAWLLVARKRNIA